MKNRIYFLSNILFGTLIFLIGLESNLVVLTSIISLILIILSTIGFVKTKDKE